MLKTKICKRKSINSKKNTFREKIKQEKDTSSKYQQVQMGNKFVCLWDTYQNVASKQQVASGNQNVRKRVKCLKESKTLRRRRKSDQKARVIGGRSNIADCESRPRFVVSLNHRLNNWRDSLSMFRIGFFIIDKIISHRLVCDLAFKEKISLIHQVIPW